MSIIPVRDGLAKHMSQALPVFTIAWGTYCAAAIIAAPIAIRAHGRKAILPAGLPSQTARTLLLVGAMTMFFFSVRTVPLANAIAAYFVAPFVAAALAPIVLKERFTWSVALAVIVGFVGVIVVLQPNGDFDVNILWAIGAGFSLCVEHQRIYYAEPLIETLSCPSMAKMITSQARHADRCRSAWTG